MLCGSYKALSSVCIVWLASTEVQKSNTCMFIVSGLPADYISLVTTNTMHMIFAWIIANALEACRLFWLQTIAKVLKARLVPSTPEGPAMQ